MEDLLEEIGKELPPAEARETYETLAKILGNILKNPAEAKFRSLKKDNKLIATKILRSNNAASLLLTMGFDDEDGMYRLAADGDLETMRTVHELLECIILSAAEQEPSSNADAKASAPAPCSAEPAVVAVAAVTAVAAAAKPKPAAGENPIAFGRRPEKTQHQQQIDQLAEARAAQRAQYIENPQGPTPVAAPVAQAAGYPAAAAAAAAADTAPDAKKKSNQTAFDFSNRNKKEQERVAADQSLAEMRKAQKDKFKDFQSDPNAKQQEAYKQPPSVTAGAKAEDSGWFGGWFGGGSGSDGSSKPTQRPEERRKPNIKGVADLPKPIQRGGG